MPYPYVLGPGGVGTARTARHKTVWRGGSIPIYFPGGRYIDSTKSRDPLNADDVTVLQAGLLMGKITSSGLYAPSILGVTTNAEAIGSTAIEAAAAVVTELVRRVGSTGTFTLTGPPTANGVVDSETVTYSAASGTTITCTALTKAFVAGSFIQPTDGSQTPIAFIGEGYGMPMVEFDGTAAAAVQFPEIPLDAIVVSSQLVNWPSDTSLRAWIVSRLCDVGGGKYIFDHLYRA
jgi:hypothetical protein